MFHRHRLIDPLSFVCGFIVAHVLILVITGVIVLGGR